MEAIGLFGPSILDIDLSISGLFFICSITFFIMLGSFIMFWICGFLAISAKFMELGSSGALCSLTAVEPACCPSVAGFGIEFGSIVDAFLIMSGVIIPSIMSSCESLMSMPSCCLYMFLRNPRSIVFRCCVMLFRSWSLCGSGEEEVE